MTHSTNFKSPKCRGGAWAAPHDAKRMEDARKQVRALNKEEDDRAWMRRVNRYSGPSDYSPYIVTPIRKSA